MVSLPAVIQSVVAGSSMLQCLYLTIGKQTIVDLNGFSRMYVFFFLFDPLVHKE